MRIHVVLGFCVAFSAVFVPSTAPIPPSDVNRTRNSPLTRFINAVGSRTRKVLSHPQKELPLKWAAGDLKVASSIGNPYGHAHFIPQHPLQFQPHLILQHNLIGNPHGHPHETKGWGEPVKGHGGWGQPEKGHGGWGGQPGGHHNGIGPHQVVLNPHGHVHSPHEANAGGWGWEGPRKQPPLTSHPQKGHHGGWGWKKENVCVSLANRTILRLEDLEPDWRILRVLGEKKRAQVNPVEVFVPPLQEVPFPPVQLKAETSTNYEITFVDEISIDFDQEAANAGFSVTRSRFSTRNDSQLPQTSLTGGETNGENILRATVAIFKLPKAPTPLRGKFNLKGHFDAGLERARRARAARETAPPVENFFRKDLLFAAELFERLTEFEGGEGEVGGRGEENWVDMPTLVGRVEKHTLPDIDHSERTILDVEFNFGLPASNVEYQSVGVTMEEWKAMRRDRRRRLQRAKDVATEFGGLGGFLAESEDFVRSRLKLQRSFGLESYKEAERRVQEEYVVAQFLICPMREGDCAECPLDPIRTPPMVVDAKYGSGSFMSSRPRPGGREGPRG